MTTVLGLDIGGANLKAAHSTGVARSLPFALWRQPQLLPTALNELLATLPPFDSLAVTMTGELCDCFPTKRAGVNAILDAVTSVAGEHPVWVWRTDRRLVDVATARLEPFLIAAANWLALAVFVGQLVPEGATLLVDVGSTTTDLIPIQNGIPIPQGLTDTARLASSELVYTGGGRTPICALLGSQVMAEFFATTLDAYLLLGLVPEGQTCETADGQPATRLAAHARMARMIGGDSETCSEETVLALARQTLATQMTLLRYALLRSTRPLQAWPTHWVVAGSGEWLARYVLTKVQVPETQIISLRERWGADCSTAACAYAVAQLAQAGPQTENTSWK